jgi:hypothetical protein
MGAKCAASFPPFTSERGQYYLELDRHLHRSLPQGIPQTPLGGWAVSHLCTWRASPPSGRPSEASRERQTLGLVPQGEWPPASLLLHQSEKNSPLSEGLRLGCKLERGLCSDPRRGRGPGRHGEGGWFAERSHPAGRAPGAWMSEWQGLGV